MKINIKKLVENAIIPIYKTASAAGADLYACINKEIEIKSKETKMISTGIALEIPDNYVGLIYARSGLSTKEGLAPANKVGVIDSDYRGEIIVSLYNQSNETRKIKPQQRIAQLVITPIIKAEFIETCELNNTKRGSNGFGSTGTK